MQIIRSIDETNLSTKQKTIVLGNFDGVHLGHQKLISTAKDISGKSEGETIVFTFYPHPQVLFNRNFKMLNSFQLKTTLLQKMGVDYLISVNFTEKISRLTPKEFVKDILYKKLGANHLVVGFNYSFGFKGEGKVNDLIVLANEFGMSTTVMEPFYLDDQLVSSTLIRHYLETGQIENATKFLGYAPRIKGQVIEGKKLGRKLGFPTANIKWDENLIIPQNGVYAVKVIINNEAKQGILNIGLKPTVTEEKIKTMEVNILDFAEDLYNKELEIIFHKKIRDEKKFATLLELKNQITTDKLTAVNYFLNI